MQANGARRRALMLGSILWLLAGCSGAMAPAPPPATISDYVEPTQAAQPAPPLPTGAPAETTAAEETAAPAPTRAPDPAALIQAEFERMSQGSILYNPPEQMRVGQTERVEVRITKGDTAKLAEGLEGRGEPTVEQMAVASFMAVRLNGAGFHIEPLGSEEQVIVGDTYTQWAWDVTPKEAGDQSLDLIVTARVKLQGYSDERKDLEVIRRHIVVRVDPKYAVASFIGSNKDWLIPSVLIPLIAAAGTRAWRRIRRRPAKPAGEGK
jgi:hypothetical protein